MGWTIGGEALPTDNAVAVVTTSTSTLCLTGSSGYARLRMYGIDPYAVAFALAGTDAGLGVSDVQEPPPPWTPVGVPVGPTIAWLDSPVVIAATAATGDYAFSVVRRSTSGTYPLGSTVIPQVKDALWLDGESCQPLYKDAHVLDLRYGQGYLMVAARYWASGLLFGAGGVNPGPENSKSAIVGFWAPANDPDFASPEVRGPLFLVSRIQEVDGATAALWLGVPSAAHADPSGTATVFVYYTGEQSHLPADLSLAPPLEFVPGTRMRAIAVADLCSWFGIEELSPPAAPNTGEILEEMEIMALASTLGSAWVASAMIKLTMDRINLAAALAGRAETGSTVVLPTSSASSAPPAEWIMNEELWDSAAGACLVPGDYRGKVRIWVATGDPFQEKSDPDLSTDTRGNLLLWERYEAIHDVDAQAVWASGQLVLFVSANASQDRRTKEVTDDGISDLAFGIYRCAALPVEVAGEFGMDFVIHEFDPASTALTDRDLVTRATELDADFRGVHRLDPDPVQLPNGEWLLFNGAVTFLERNSAPDADVRAPWSDAWT